MQKLICPNCGYAKVAFPGKLTVMVSAKVTMTIDRQGNPKPALSRRVSMKKGKLGSDPIVTCPNCGEEFSVSEIVMFGCSHCGRELPKDRLDEYFCRSSIDLRCPDHIDTYYCDGCVYASECKLREKMEAVNDANNRE